jgi:hypothetical protein
MLLVKNKLVFRLREAPSDQLLAQINVEFADILTSGDFAVGGPLSGEDEPELADMPRLIFRFNRRSLGRLRQLVDVLNRGHIEP